MKRTIQWVLLDTKPGDLLLKLFEQTTGLGLVRLEEIDGERVRATTLGRRGARVS